MIKMLKDKNQIRNFLLIIFFLTVTLISPFLLVIVYSQTTAVSTPTATLFPSEDKDIKLFKEKIATKVAALQEKNNKVISGYVTQKEDSVLKIKTNDEQIYEIKIDPLLTKFYQINSNQQIEIKFSDIKKDDYLFVTGVINDKIINANSVFVDESLMVLSGRVTEIDKENYSLKVLTNERENYTLDIETTTKQLMVNIKILEIERIGFSKIKEGDIIHFVFKKSASTVKENRYSALKILIIPQEYFLK